MLEASAIILSGGKNTRMKKNKAFLTVDDEQLIKKTVNSLRVVFPEIIIVTNQPEHYSNLGAIIARDIIPQKGPLSGMHAGLVRSSFRHSLIVACDMPFINTNLASYMVNQAQGYDVVVPKISNYFQPLYAVYSKGCIGPIQHCLEKNIFKIIAFYGQVKVKQVSERELKVLKLSEQIFFNINTPDDLQTAKVLVSEIKGYKYETNKS